MDSYASMSPASLFREIDKQPERPRDWDHEGTLETLEAECAVDRKETGCAAHDYFVYDSGHFLVWRDWSEAFHAHPEAETLTERDSMRTRAADAAAGLGLEPEELEQIALHRVVTEYEATGQLILGNPTADPEPDEVPTKGLYFSTCICRGRIKGGYRVRSETHEGETNIHVDCTRKGHKRAHRKFVKEGLIPKNGHMAEGLLEYMRGVITGRATV